MPRSGCVKARFRMRRQPLREVLSLPMYPELSATEQALVTNAVVRACAREALV